MLTRDQIKRLVPRAVRDQLRRGAFKIRAKRSSDLDALAIYFGTDKSPRGHNYTPLYRKHLGPRRKTICRMLEIGVGGTTPFDGYETLAGGQSLHMWSRYFPNATILGIDIYAKSVSGPRIRFEQGSQSDSDFLQRISRNYGPFDLVVDDGSHIGEDIVASFNVLWDAVAPGGFYVIEDLEVAHHPDWGGGPPGTPAPAVEMLKAKLDDTLRRWDDPSQPPIAGLHIYGEIAFLEKAST